MLNELYNNKSTLTKQQQQEKEDNEIMYLDFHLDDDLLLIKNQLVNTTHDIECLRDFDLDSELTNECIELEKILTSDDSKSESLSIQITQKPHEKNSRILSSSSPPNKKQGCSSVENEFETTSPCASPIFFTDTSVSTLGECVPKPKDTKPVSLSVSTRPPFQRTERKKISSPITLLTDDFANCFVQTETETKNDDDDIDILKKILGTKKRPRSETVPQSLVTDLVTADKQIVEIQKNEALEYEKSRLAFLRQYCDVFVYDIKNQTHLIKQQLESTTPMSGVIGNNTVQQGLAETIVKPLILQKISKNFKITTNCIIVGPDECGKKFMVSKAAYMANCSLITYKPERYTQNLLYEIYAWAEDYKPCVVLLENFDNACSVKNDFKLELFAQFKKHCKNNPYVGITTVCTLRRWDSLGFCQQELNDTFIPDELWNQYNEERTMFVNEYLGSNENRIFCCEKLTHNHIISIVNKELCLSQDVIDRFQYAYKNMCNVERDLKSIYTDAENILKNNQDQQQQQQQYQHKDSTCEIDPKTNISADNYITLIYSLYNLTYSQIITFFKNIRGSIFTTLPYFKDDNIIDEDLELIKWEHISPKLQFYSDCTQDNDSEPRYTAMVERRPYPPVKSIVSIFLYKQTQQVKY